MHQISHIIRERRSVYPRSYSDKEITDDEIWEILENANWAPTHKKTEPWRFKVYRGEAKQRIGSFLAEHYRVHTADALFSELKYEKMQAKAEQSSCIIVICMQRDPDERLPEWEELSAVACAVQNMWLTCTAMDIGAYWSSPSALINAREFLQLKQGERCLGLFYMGKSDLSEAQPTRRPIAEKVEWIDK